MVVPVSVKTIGAEPADCGCTVIDVLVTAVTLPTVTSGSGAEIRTTVALKGLPVAVMNTCDPTKSEATVVVALS